MQIYKFGNPVKRFDKFIYLLRRFREIEINFINFVVVKLFILIHFFKQKPFLCDLIPNNHIDIHSHLLPGIDDGATTIDDTTLLIEGLQQLGIRKFITTPHVMGEVWKNTRVQIEGNLKNTTQELQIPNIKDNFRTAAEYMIDSEFINLFMKEKLLTLKENYVLVEISYLNPPIQLFDILFELQLAGYQPVLAHPERYSFYHHSLNSYKKLKNFIFASIH